MPVFAGIGRQAIFLIGDGWTLDTLNMNSDQHSPLPYLGPRGPPGHRFMSITG
jgi:hypothetical protein